MLSKVKFSKTWIKLVYLWVCFAKFFWGRDRRFKKRNKFGFWEEINFYTFTEQLSKNLIFVFSVDFWEAFFVISPRLIIRALVSKVVKVQDPIFIQKPRSKEKNQKNQKRIITCGLDENYFPFNFYVDLCCFQREKISHRARIIDERN